MLLLVELVTGLSLWLPWSEASGNWNATFRGAALDAVSERGATISPGDE